MTKRSRYDGPNSEVIEISVGGRFFSTTLGTLRFEPDSVLSKMFSEMRGVFNGPTTDGAGRPFLDHDAEVFELILGYLRRGGRLVGAPRDVRLLDKVLIDADFFGLQGLVLAVHKIFIDDLPSKALDVPVKNAMALGYSIAKLRQIFQDDLPRRALDEQPISDAIAAGYPVSELKALYSSLAFADQ
jgi:hypothetical protein